MKPRPNPRVQRTRTPRFALSELVLWGTHFNFGFSTDWADFEKFTRRALELVVDALDIPESAPELLFELPSFGSQDL